MGFFKRLPLSWLDSLHSEDRSKVIHYIEEKKEGDLTEIIFPDYRVIKPDGTTKWISARCFPILDENGKMERIAGIAADITARKTLEDEKNELIETLQKALDEIKTLKGILPLCSFCKKIRDPEGQWEEVDDYIYQHSEANVSHTVCPKCMKQHYPEYSQDE